MKRVLIIENDEEFCSIMTLYLSKKQCVTVICKTAEEGVKKVKEKLPDLVILSKSLDVSGTTVQEISILAPEAKIFVSK